MKFSIDWYQYDVRKRLGSDSIANTLNFWTVFAQKQKNGGRLKASFYLPAAPQAHQDDEAKRGSPKFQRFVNKIGPKAFPDVILVLIDR